MRVKKHCILGAMILLFSTLFSRTFFFGFVRILSENPYYEIVSGVSETQKNKSFLYILLHVWSFWGQQLYTYDFADFSLILCLTIRVICQEDIHWRMTEDTHWRMTEDTHWRMTEDTHWKWESLIQTLRYIIFIINYCFLWDIEN